MGKTLLEKSVEYLKQEKIIKRDQEIVDSLKYSKGTISAYISGKTLPSPKFIQKFENFYKIKLENFKNENDDEKNFVVEPETNINSITEKTGENFNLQIIVNLTKSNKLLSEAHKIFAEASLMLSKNNTELIEMAKTNFQNSIPTQPAFDARYTDFLELLADVAAGKRYKSKQEALASLSSMLHGTGENKTVAGTQKN